MQSLNIEKILQALEQREVQIRTLKAGNQDNEEFAINLRDATNKEIYRVKQQAVEETRVKNQMIGQVEHFRKEINLLRGDDFHSLNVWKTKINSL